MWDFTSTMANYVDDDIVLTTMAELENAELYEWRSDDAAKLAVRVVGKTADRSPATRDAFREALKNRRPESIENLLERSLRSENLSADSAHQRFKYAINRLFCLVGWNINLTPLDRFLQAQISAGDAQHTFVSFNYDLVLDFSVQKIIAEWQPDTGYGFNIPFYVTDDLPPTENIAGTLDHVRALPFSNGGAAGTATILKPHGSLNWLIPYQMPYAQLPRGIELLDSQLIVPLTTTGAIRYWCSKHTFQHIALPNGMPTDVGICILPPSSAKRSELSFLKTTREAESNALTSADDVVVIGWSVPETDIDQAELIEEAIKRRTNPIHSLTIVNLNAPSAYFDRLAHLFQVGSRSLRKHNSGFLDFVA